MPGSSSSSTSLHLAASPAALGEATGQANSLEMAPRRRTKGEKVGGGDAEEKKVDTLAAVVVAVPSSSSSAPSNNDVAAPIGQRRLDAQRHRHAEVWTKDPHGGRHRPAGPSSRGLDPLTHDPTSGDPLPLPPAGFEKPLRTGPTTNFVGDAMLGTPMDLIGARLAAADASASSAAAAAAALAPSSPSSGKPLPLAAPAKKLLVLKGSPSGREQNEENPDALPFIERYDFARAREVAAALLGRRLPSTATAKARARQEGQEQRW